jgi:hypothetical protein
MHPQPSTVSKQRRRMLGSVLLEVSIGLALTAFVAVATLRQSMLAISAGQWAAMQAVTDAYLTRETALATRLPYDQLQQSGHWPPVSDATSVTVSLGSIADPAGHGTLTVTGRLTRSSSSETISADNLPEVRLTRLDSVLSYQIGGQSYLKSRSTLRTR